MKPDEILQVIAEHYGLTLEELRAGRRTRFRTWGRHVAAYILRRTGRYSQADIARILNYGDHTGVIDAIQRVRREVERDPAARADLEALEAEFGDLLPAETPRRVTKSLFPLAGRPLFPSARKRGAR